MRVLLPFLALYRRHAFLLTLGVVLSALALLASIGLLALSGWFLAGAAIAGIPGAQTFNYLLPAAGVRGAAILRTLARYAERLVSHDATFRVLAHLRVFAFRKILPLTPGAITRFRQGELLNRLVADIETLDHLYLRVIAPVVAALLVVLLLGFTLGRIDAGLARTLGGILASLLLCLPFVFYQAGKVLGRELTVLRGQYRGLLISVLQGQAEISVFGAQTRFRQQLAAIEAQWLQQQKKQAALTGLAQAAMISASGVCTTLILWMAASRVWDVPRPAAIIALFVFCSLAAFEALAPATAAFQHLGQVIASASRVSQLLDQRPEVSFPASGPPAQSAVEIEFRQVNFTYPGQTQSVLHDIQLSIHAGAHVALLGKTGCGKSTLLQLLTRAWDPSSGEILLNRQAVAHYDEAALRRLMAVVPQRIHVFSHSLRENLRIGKAGASDAELEAVLMQVGLENLLDNEQGLNAWMGEGGRQLSGGEQRRLGIARALLHDAPLLLLDEPTEGLDANTEQQILALLRQVGRQKTMLLITHRLQGLEAMERICVMDAGRIVESGAHAELLRQKGAYFRFVSARK